jgi:hypothetical protein
MSATEDVAAELKVLSTLPLPELRAYWPQRWGDLPANRAQDQLRRTIAYRLQAEVQGGLSSRVKRDLTELATRFTDDRGFNPGPAIVLKPGCSLIREWGGKRHEVAVVDGGFVYDGAHFTSLSKIAGLITGTKWNGPVFFGIKPRKAPKLAAAQ